MSDPAFLLIQPVAVLPLEGGAGIFLGYKEGEKVMHFFTDTNSGMAIDAAMTGKQPPRPQTHDLFNHTLMALGAEIKDARILSCEDDVYYSQLTVGMENELGEKKIVQIDARPSDAIAMAAKARAPIHIRREVFEAAEDKSSLLQAILDERSAGQG